MSNTACRIFKEQLEVILCLPEDQQGKAIIAILKNAFEIEHNAELEPTTQSIVNLLKKTITAKEFSNNYGGRRINAGRKEKTTTEAVVLCHSKKEKEMIENTSVSDTNSIKAEVPSQEKKEKIEKMLEIATNMAKIDGSDVCIGFNAIKIMNPTLREWTRNHYQSMYGTEWVEQKEKLINWMIDHKAGQTMKAQAFVKLVAKFTNQSPAQTINEYFAYGMK